MEREEKKELELYVHIPFCVKKCAYCDFLSAPASESVRGEYVEVLLQEIKDCKAVYGDRPVSTVFVGGGTPSILTSRQIMALFDALRHNFHILEDAEITTEANPDTVTMEKIQAWKEAGVNRVSVGLQSACDEELKLLGRVHDFAGFLKAYHMLRDAGFFNINIDLISAIPGQTLQSWLNTLHRAAGLSPSHLSAYSLIVEEGTPFFAQYGEKRTEEEEELDREIYAATGQILAEYGYIRYEISNYAKPGCMCRHNIGYWTRKDYLGLGLGAASLIGKQRFHRPTVLKEYLQKVRLKEDLCEETESLSIREEMEEFMFLGLRMMQGISCAEFYRLFGKKIEEIYKSPLLKLEQKGLLKREEGYVRLTERGIDISNYVFGEFLL